MDVSLKAVCDNYVTNIFSNLLKFYPFKKPEVDANILQEFKLLSLACFKDKKTGYFLSQTRRKNNN